ncbi:unnamed protein product [Sympodiomycopsis kandeliae]
MSSNDHPPMKPLWVAPDDQKRAHPFEAFRRYVNHNLGKSINTYDEMHQWSITDVEDFWTMIWDFSNITGRKFHKALSDPNALPADLPRWFEGSRFNFAENILYPRSYLNPDGTPVHPEPEPDNVAIIEVPEGGGLGTSPPQLQSREVTWRELRHRVAVLAEAFRRKGIKEGDRVASISANTPQPLVTLFALNSIGAIYSLIATDSGPQAIYSRLSQIRPKLITTDDGVIYNGKPVNVLSRVQEVAERLIQEGKIDDPMAFEAVIMRNGRLTDVPRWTSAKVRGSDFDTFLGAVGLSQSTELPLYFEQLSAMHPVQIFFSSGTTGEPKCITHAQTMLVNSRKEGLLCYGITRKDRWLQLTSTGWIMFMYHLIPLASGGTAVTYDGSPLFPDPSHIPRLVARHQLTGFGASPRFLSELDNYCKKHGFVPQRDLDLSKFRLMTSTGAPLSMENASFFYRAFPSTAHLASMSGGTDLAGCVTGPTAFKPLYGHMMQSKVLGVDLQIWDSETGEKIDSTGRSGELVVAKPFPTAPLYFFGLESEKKALYDKYMDSYFNRFPGKKVWAQGDFIFRDPATGGYEIVGRSDSVLNPSGVRFGSAEIYNVVEKFAFINDSVCVGQRRPKVDADERVLLFVTMKAGEDLTDQRIRAIKGAIAKAYSRRHVPEHIFRVQDIPVTLTGKKTELAVKAVVCANAAFKPSSATANPQALDEYRQYADLEGVLSRQKSTESANAPTRSRL